MRIPAPRPTNLVYAGNGHEVKTVMVTDETAVHAEAQAQAKEVARRVAADAMHKEMALLEAMQAERLQD